MSTHLLNTVNAEHQSVAQSFGGLVKTNNGLFKSIAQRDFLLARTVDGVFTTSGNVHGNGFTIEYVCDELGVTKVVKRTSRKDEVTWERVVPERVAVQDAKALAHRARLVKRLIKSIQERNAAKERGEYDDAIGLYNMSHAADVEALANLGCTITQPSEHPTDKGIIVWQCINHQNGLVG